MFELLKRVFFLCCVLHCVLYTLRVVSNKISIKYYLKSKSRCRWRWLMMAIASARESTQYNTEQHAHTEWQQRNNNKLFARLKNYSCCDSRASWRLIFQQWNNKHWRSLNGDLHSFQSCCKLKKSIVWFTIASGLFWRLNWELETLLLLAQLEKNNLEFKNFLLRVLLFWKVKIIHYYYVLRLLYENLTQFENWKAASCLLPDWNRILVGGFEYNWMVFGIIYRELNWAILTSWVIQVSYIVIFFKTLNKIRYNKYSSTAMLWNHVYCTLCVRF